MSTPTPPPRLPISDGWQMTLQLSIGGQTGALVLGAKYSSGNAIDRAQGAELWRDKAWANLRGGMSNQVTCTGAIVRHVNGQNATVYELSAPPSPNGFINSTTGLWAAATLVKWSTARGGRSGKGRTFLPGLPASAIDGNGRTLTSAHSTTVQPYVTSYVQDSALQAYGLRPAVLSFRLGEAFPILDGSVAGVVGLQRRRMR